MRIEPSGWVILLVFVFVSTGPSCTSLGGATLGPALQRQSLEIARQLEESGQLSGDSVLNAYVAAVGERLVAQTPDPSAQPFRFAVLDDPAPNAFALPSGHIYVSRGLLVLMGSEDALAGVLGHEIGHVVKQHSLKRATGQIPFTPIRLVTRIGGGIAGLVLPGVGQVIRASGELPAALTGASYSRSQESEADEVGQRLAASAGWDASALSRVMDALARDQALHGQDPTETSWFATHPSSPDRAERIRRRADSLVVGPSDPIAATRRAFLERLEGLVVGSSARNGVFDGSEFLHPVLGFAVRFPTGEGWVQIDTRRVVATVRESPPAAVLLEVVAEGDDALAVARRFRPQSGQLDAPPKAEIINGLPTAHATGSAAGGWGREPVRGSARWIAHGGYVYRILCESTEAGYATLAGPFEATERSFRVLAAADRDRIFESRLHIATAQSGEDLAALLARVGSDWQLEQAAAANALEPGVALAQGEPVKVTRRQKFSLHR